MQSIPIKVDGIERRVSFFPDDTIDVVRQHVALVVGSHPDRLFIEVKVKLPKGYYGTNNMRWKELFFRLAYNRARIRPEAIEAYKDGNPRPGLDTKEYSEWDWEQAWENRGKELTGLGSILTSGDFYEWRILGVDSEMSLVMPKDPVELPDYNGSPPLPKLQSLFETMHPYEVTEFRYAVTREERGPPEGIRKNYFPYFNPDRTPQTIGDDMGRGIIQARRDLNNLFELLDRTEAPKPTKHQKVAILRAKWIVPLISTQFTAPRVRFEQIFYGLTVSKETPYIGYFTAKTEITRHKFYVKDPNNKVVDETFKPMWRAWTNKTQPQRRLPTLLLYRGTSRTNFDRIAITSKDIIFSSERDKTSEETLDEIRDSLAKWFSTLDAVVPFVEEEDLDPSRWQLDMLNALATYPDAVRGFDMSRFSCLRNVFGYYGDTYRLIRAENSSDDISPLEIQAYQVLNQEDVTPSAELLVSELGLPAEEAEALYSKIQTLGDTFDIEKAAKAYPVLKFTGSELILKFVTNLERTLKYAEILRFVLSLNRDQSIGICEPDIREDAPVVAIPQQAVSETDYDASNEDFLAGLDLDVPAGEAPAEEEPGAAAARVEPRDRRVAIAQSVNSTFNYFNARLQEFDPRTFDSTYPGECERNRQVIVLDDEDQQRIRTIDKIPPEQREIYTYSGRPESEKLLLTKEDGDTGIAICPPYWCIRDEIPLLPPKDAEEPGHLTPDFRCPVCGGKLRTSDRDDRTEFTVIERNTASIYPNFLKALSETNKQRMPCCYRVPRPSKEGKKKGDDANYVLGLERSRVPALRFAYLDPELARRIGIEPQYESSIKLGRLGVGNEDIFRIGIGRASETLPILLKDATEIKRPKDAPDNVKKCSFFLSWNKPGKGETQTERIIDGIDNAYMSGDLGIVREVEYVASFMDTMVIRIDPKTYEVMCGFWSETVKADHKILVLIGNDALGFVSRKKGVRAHVLDYKVDLKLRKFGRALDIIRNAHSLACSGEVPTFDETLKTELRGVGEGYSYILDPLDRVQAIFVHGRAVLPVRPALPDLSDSDIPKIYYNQLRDTELPDPGEARAFLDSRRHEGFHVKEKLYNADGDLVEFLLSSGFRSPVKYSETKPDQPIKEVTETIRAVGEDMLVDGEPKEDDENLARKTTYEEEIYQFLLYSLSKDIVSEYGSLREAIELGSQPRIEKQLTNWFKENVSTSSADPVDFINKVRKPCGQFKNDAKGCADSTLCALVRMKDKNVCRVKVHVKKEGLTTARLIGRMAYDLKNNRKVRNLVLDDRLSPFFSTVLYLEMPHELITTEV